MPYPDDKSWHGLEFPPVVVNAGEAGRAKAFFDDFGNPVVDANENPTIVEPGLRTHHVLSILGGDAVREPTIEAIGLTRRSSDCRGLSERVSSGGGRGTTPHIIDKTVALLEGEAKSEADRVRQLSQFLIESLSDTEINQLSRLLTDQG